MQDSFIQTREKTEIVYEPDFMMSIFSDFFWLKVLTVEGKINLDVVDKFDIPLPSIGDFFIFWLICVYLLFPSECLVVLIQNVHLFCQNCTQTRLLRIRRKNNQKTILTTLFSVHVAIRGPKI